MIRKQQILWALAGVVAVACGCTPPKQARFAFPDCASASIAFEPAQAEWRVQPTPQIERGPESSWDASDVLNPSVVVAEGRYYNFYSGFDGTTWRTGLAVSEDGETWEKHPANPVLEPDASTWEGGYIAANGTVAQSGDEFLQWYQAGPRNQTLIGLARSDDGATWEKHPAPVLETGPPGTWDESGLGDPYVLSCGDSFYLFFLGQNRFGVQRLGVARSEDGVVWQKSHLNPLLEPGGTGSFDERGLGEPAVFRTADSYWMIYVGRDAQERRSIGWAKSPDGVNWRKVPELGLLTGRNEWNAAVVCDPSVWFDGALKVWYGGGDRASPDENLNGQIGLAVLESAPQGL